jgi:hypothetical protein
MVSSKSFSAACEGYLTPPLLKIDAGRRMCIFADPQLHLTLSSNLVAAFVKRDPFLQIRHHYLFISFSGNSGIY